jgi:hypothetical protein
MLRLGWFIVPALIVAGVVIVVTTASSLPPWVASKFGSGGAPIGAMSRDGYTVLMAALVGLTPAAMIVLGGWLPGRLASTIRVGRQTVPERHVAAARRIVQGFMLSTAAAMVAFMVAMHLLIVQAHATVPPHLDEAPFFVLIGVFVLVLLAGSLLFHRQLRSLAGRG